MANQTLEARFWAKVQKTDGCWLWTGAQAGGGYGQIRRSGRKILAHRLSWELRNGPIPQGLCVLHRCDVRACVNPQHLFLGTDADNMADRDEKGRHITHRGESSCQAKLTNELVQAILSREGHTQRGLAAEFGVSYSLISRIRSRKAWAHIMGAA